MTIYNYHPLKLLSKLSSNPDTLDRVILDNSKFQGIFSESDVLTSTKTILDVSYYKILLALCAIKRGSDLMEVCKLICWKDFEIFSSEILRHHKFNVILNYRLKNPTRQIDVIGTKSKLALIIDCKHWRKSSYSAFKKAVEKHKERALLLGRRKSLKNISKVFPMIVTFVPLEYRQVDGVPIIPIQLLNSFLLEFEFYIEDYFTI